MKKNKKERVTDIIILTSIGTAISAANTFLIRSELKKAKKNEE